MRIGLFILCYIDAFVPEVSIATHGLPGAQGLTPLFLVAITH